MTVFLAQTFFPFLLVVGGVIDFLTYRIPNGLTIAIAVAFSLWHSFTGLPMEQVLWQCLASFILLAIGFGLFATGLFGGGDAKLLAAAGLWFVCRSSCVPDLYRLAGGGLAASVGGLERVHIDQEIRGGTGSSAG